MTEAVSSANARQYSWGSNCDGWHLLDRKDMSVIQERVPPGAMETMHFHERSRQFFYVLEGEGQMRFESEIAPLRAGDGLEIPPLVKHRFENNSGADVIFLVVSVPESHSDRVDVD